MRKITILFILIIILFLGAFIWWKNGNLAIDPENKKQIIFIVKPGQGIREIASDLQKEGLIKNPVVFFLLVRQMGLDGKIQAGDFRLSSSQTPAEIAENLTHGTLDIWITVPEGKRGTEIDDILKEKIPTYDTSWKNELIQHEGYLFPDTYLIPKDADIAAIISIMTDNFDKKYATIEPGKKTNLTKNEIVTMASLVEREAKFSEDRPLVASVLINRKNIGMKLDIDATIQYALGYQQAQKTWWKKDLTKADLNLNSPYNTYLNPGLPPTPIANPGIEALIAVINPASTDYIYYISDSTGHNHYAKTIEEHNANISKYGL